MGFLKRLSEVFKSSLPAKSRRPLSGAVDREEAVARFLCHGSDLHAATGRVKPGRYLPRDGRTSVFRINGLELADIRSLGNAILRNPPPIAHARTIAAVVYDCGLTFDPNNEPARHADIVGWPDRKEHQKLIALKIAEVATTFRY